MINLSIGVILVLIGLKTHWALPAALYLTLVTYLAIKASERRREIPSNFLRGLTFAIAPIVYGVDWSEIFDRVKRRNSNWPN